MVIEQRYCLGKLMQIAEKDAMGAPWAVDEIGEQILQSMPQWPRLLKPNEV